LLFKPLVVHFDIQCRAIWQSSPSFSA